MRFWAVFFLVLTSAEAFAAKLDLWVDWYPGTEYAGVVTALEKGWYAKEGIQLQIHFREPNISRRVVQSRNGIGLEPAAQFIRDRKSGIKLKAFAAHYQFSPQTILVSDDSLEKIAQLKGKRLGVFDQYDRDTYKVILEHEGVSLKDVNLIKLASDQDAMVFKYLRQNHVDALIGWEFHWPGTGRRELSGLRQFPSYRYGYYFYGEVFVAQPRFLSTNQKLLTRFLAITRKGWDHVFKNPPLPTELNLGRRFMYDGIPRNSYGEMTHLAWQKSLKIAKKHGFSAPEERVEDVADFTIVNSLRKAAR